MIYDHRTYTCRPGTIQRQMQLYAEHGWAVQRRHLGEPLMFATTETGNVNSYIHVWVYESAADREQKRARLQQDPEWRSYLQRSAEAGNLISQTNTILKPAPFFGASAPRS
jgi:leucyl-tRNA synthetase